MTSWSPNKAAAGSSASSNGSSSGSGSYLTSMSSGTGSVSPVATWALECKISLVLDEQDANGASTIHTMAAMVVLKVSRAHNLIILLLATSFGRIDSIRPIDNCNIGNN
jgi:hypothetical protein